MTSNLPIPFILFHKYVKQYTKSKSDATVTLDHTPFSFSLVNDPGAHAPFSNGLWECTCWKNPFHSQAPCTHTVSLGELTFDAFLSVKTSYMPGYKCRTGASGLPCGRPVYADWFGRNSSCKSDNSRPLSSAHTWGAPASHKAFGDRKSHPWSGRTCHISGNGI